MQYEKERAAYIHAFIRTKQAMLREQLEGVAGDEMELKETFWDHVTVNFSNSHEIQETISSIKQQAELLHERERSGALIKKQMRTLRRLADSPYFGRIDLKIEGEDQAEPIYIGLASLMDENDSDFLIYDWRAPISSVYYDSEIGPVTYTAPAGTVKGVLENKRQYVFRRGELKAMFDTSLAIGDERLKESLSEGASRYMKSIVATIQKEQNQIIRNERSRFLIVRGAAGSGKTSAALQRAAYLLYRHRSHIEANQLVLFSPNELFSSYVSTVLPELGEENMKQLTFRGYLYKRLGRVYEVEDGFAQLEYILGAAKGELYRTRMRSIAVKSGRAFKEKLDAFIEKLKEGGLFFKDIRFRKKTLIPKEDIETYFYCLDHGIPLQNRLRLTGEWLLKEIAKQEGKERSEAWVEKARELLDNETLLRTHWEVEKATANEEGFGTQERQEQLIAKQLVREAFEPLKKRIKALAFIDSEKLYEQFLFDDCHRDTEGFAAVALWSSSEISKKRMPYEDATPFLYLQDRIKGLQVDRSIKHVFIDEAQDYTHFQLVYMQMLYPAAHFTIVGDVSQTLYFHGPNQTGLIGGDEADVKYMAFYKSYRSTEAIIRFAREMLPNPEEIIPFERPGDVPVLVKGTSRQALIKPVKEWVEQMGERGYRTVAVIVKTAKEANDVHAQLSEWLDIQLVAKDHHEYKEGAVVLPVYLAKGIEFDAVGVFDASASHYASSQERYHLYTACTRAMDHLTVFAAGEWSPWLKPIPSHLYEEKQALS
ncbi:RNA polymerase recycling motor HelD [Shouchella clausii]|uniref:RNA polymerase recycling motor HelD n=1 Tax=Shouchella clausii TaxID=79880 RepID=UPI003182DA82